MANSADDVLERLRAQPPARLAFRGFGPLVVAVVFLVSMMLLLPSIAPVEEGERPVDGTTTTTTTSTTASTTTTTTEPSP